MPKQVGNQNSKSLLRQATFGSFTRASVIDRDEILLVNLFCTPSPAEPGATAPLASLS